VIMPTRSGSQPLRSVSDRPLTISQSEPPLTLTLTSATNSGFALYRPTPFFLQSKSLRAPSNPSLCPCTLYLSPLSSPLYSHPSPSHHGFCCSISTPSFGLVSLRLVRQLRRRLAPYSSQPIEPARLHRLPSTTLRGRLLELELPLPVRCLRFRPVPSCKVLLRPSSFPTSASRGDPFALLFLLFALFRLLCNER
jgi:hypothetical protein